MGKSTVRRAKPLGLKPSAKAVALLEESPRPYRTHYAGGVMHIGAAKTFEGAAEAAFSHVLRGHTSNAQVVAPNGADGFRFHWTSYGVSVYVGPDYVRPTFDTTGAGRVKTSDAHKVGKPPNPFTKLRRVK
jgi:hypothetical protein